MWSPERRAGSAKIFGPAVTVKMVLASDTATPTPARHFVDCNEKGKVMFVQQPKGLYSACWGGLMSTRAKVLGAAGVIIDGKFRDIGEHRELGFPVQNPSQIPPSSFTRPLLTRCMYLCTQLFAREMSILGSNTFTKASEINVPLQFKGDLWINPDDLVVGDADGVVVVPPSLAEKVVALCEERAEIDKKTIEALLNGAEMGPTIKQLRKQ